MIQSETMRRVAEIAASAATLEAAFEMVAAEFGPNEAASLTTEMAAAWHELHRPQERVAPSAEQLTTFGAPRMLDPFIARVHSEATIYASYTHGDAAEIFTRWHASNIRYCQQTGVWHCWDGQRWRANARGQVLDALDHFLAIYGQAALLELDPKVALKTQKLINSSAFRTGTFDALSAKQELWIDARQLDPDDWALNTPMGILDLKTGTMQQHAPEAMCTKMTMLAPMPLEEFAVAFPRSRFAKFLHEIFANVEDADEREELIAFEQASLGYCLTGDSSIHFLKFWYGEGRNGKSTLGEVIDLLMGDYSKKINNKLLMVSRYDAHPTEVANLMGARLVIASEISEGAYLNENMVKELTGDAHLSARFMRRDFFEFRRTHKHLIYGNTKPRLRITDAAIKARMKLTEFGVNFETNGALDPKLKMKLMAEGQLIMTWLLQGALRCVEAGLRLPHSRVVERQTDGYMDENDVVKLWIEERCVLAAATTSGEKLKSKMLTLYEDYRQWRQARGEHPEAIQRWSQMMQTHGFHVVAVRGARFLESIGLKLDRDDF